VRSRACATRLVNFRLGRDSLMTPCPLKVEKTFQQAASSGFLPVGIVPAPTTLPTWRAQAQIRLSETHEARSGTTQGRHPWHAQSSLGNSHKHCCRATLTQCSRRKRHIKSMAIQWLLCGIQPPVQQHQCQTLRIGREQSDAHKDQVSDERDSTTSDAFDCQSYTILQQRHCEQ
jgi:hypothetical protein